MDHSTGSVFGSGTSVPRPAAAGEQLPGHQGKAGRGATPESPPRMVAPPQVHPAMNRLLPAGLPGFPYFPMLHPAAAGFPGFDPSAMTLPRPQPFLNQRAKPLRRGKWTSDEEKYAAALIEAFRKGIRVGDVEDGCTLRAHLARKLQCAPMRISKKFSGASIGKMTFGERTHPEEVVREHTERLKAMDEAFRKSIERLSEDKPAAASATPNPIPIPPGSRPHPGMMAIFIPFAGQPMLPPPGYNILPLPPSGVPRPPKQQTKGSVPMPATGAEAGGGRGEAQAHRRKRVKKAVTDDWYSYDDTLVEGRAPPGAGSFEATPRRRKAKSFDAPGSSASSPSVPEAPAAFSLPRDAGSSWSTLESKVHELGLGPRREDPTSEMREAAEDDQEDVCLDALIEATGGGSPRPAPSVFAPKDEGVDFLGDGFDDDLLRSVLGDSKFEQPASGGPLLGDLI